MKDKKRFWNTQFWMYSMVVVCIAAALLFFFGKHSNLYAGWWAVIALFWVIACISTESWANSLDKSLTEAAKINAEILENQDKVIKENKEVLKHATEVNATAQGVNKNAAEICRLNDGLYKDVCWYRENMVKAVEELEALDPGNPLLHQIISDLEQKNKEYIDEKEKMKTELFPEK